MAVCCTLRVSDQPFAPDYLILIGDTFSKTKAYFWKINFRFQHDCNENKNNMY